MRAIVLPSLMAASSALLIASDFAHTRRDWMFGQAASGQRTLDIRKTVQHLLGQLKARFLRAHEDLSVWEDICFSLAFHVRAGETVAQGLKSVSWEGDSGPYDLLKKAFAAYEAGSPILDSLVSAAQGDSHMEYFAGVFQLGAMGGGDLPTLLCHASDALRRRRMKKREAKAMMAESRLTAIILTVMPWAIGFYTARFDSGAKGMLLKDPTGRALLLAAFVLWVIGVTVVWWFINTATPTALR